MAPNPTKYQVTDLGGGRYRVVTVVTVERIVTEDELREMGIEPPKADLPWEEEKRAPTPPQRRHQAPVSASPINLVMAKWRATFDSFDPRLPRQLGQWVDFYGVDLLLKAIDVVKAQRGNPLPRYDRYKAALRQMKRDEQGGPGP